MTTGSDGNRDAMAEALLLTLLGGNGAASEG